ncbi:MAG: DNA repair and recombination protein RadA [Candidatus Methylarchaceae archaeon HK01B]|nr:DNA repair and recombination protein RadA [Candidatus Methylarchaceae archaeon HK01M]MCP8311736.1 DNA repair and recombination protein RadA [Candidatus Methylarchaceae archaeon HK02M1]MCP8318838.1 DNA repair and recombination protein RadA [Candidatus Methylarchaceae archaeon HK01B]
MSESVLDLSLQNLPRIGVETEKKLVNAGIESVLDLATALPDELVEIIGGTRDRASALIFTAQEKLRESGLLEKEFIPASEVLDRRRSLMKCTTGSKNFDDLLNGGIETQAITEIWGEYGSGKSQICHTLCITSQLPVDQGGFGRGSIFIDTESTFRPERLHQIAEARGLNPDEVLNKIIFCKVYNSSHLELLVKNLGKYIEKHDVKLVLIDSIISLHRAEFMGRGTLAERQQKLNALIHRLLRLAEIFNIAVVVTNQVQAQPDTFFGDPTKPAGGHVIAHACTYRLYLKKAGADRKAIMVDSPYHPYEETRFTINEMGISDPDSKKSKN